MYLLFNEFNLKTILSTNLKFQDEKLDYAPGDTIGILPKISDDNVSTIIQRDPNLVLKQNQHILLKVDSSAQNGKKSPKLPIFLPTKQTTIYKILQESLDLHAIPKKTLLNALLKSDCVKDLDEKRALEILCSREGATVYTNEILQKQKTFLDLFKDFSSLSFSCDTIGVLFEHLPRLMPRPYSIASSPLEHSNGLIEDVKSVETNSTELKVIFSVDQPAGITTGYLEKLVRQQLQSRTKNPSIDLYLRKSNNFRLTDDDLTSPIIMIAAGTGIAPFLGFLDHRHQQILRNQHQSELTSDHEKVEPGSSWLVFGNRTKTSQIYRTKLQNYLENGTLFKLNEAFSRDSDEGQCKYVQDVISQHAKEFVNLFLKGHNERGVITKTFICGSLKMVQDVQHVIQQCLVEVTGCSETEALDRIVSMKKLGQYIEDVWV